MMHIIKMNLLLASALAAQDDEKSDFPGPIGSSGTQSAIKQTFDTVDLTLSILEYLKPQEVAKAAATSQSFATSNKELHQHSADVMLRYWSGNPDYKRFFIKMNEEKLNLLKQIMTERLGGCPYQWDNILFDAHPCYSDGSGVMYGENFKCYYRVSFDLSKLIAKVEFYQLRENELRFNSQEIPVLKKPSERKPEWILKLYVDGNIRVEEEDSLEEPIRRRLGGMECDIVYRHRYSAQILHGTIESGTSDDAIVEEIPPSLLEGAKVQYTCPDTYSSPRGQFFVNVGSPKSRKK